VLAVSEGRASFSVLDVPLESIAPGSALIAVSCGALSPSDDALPGEHVGCVSAAGTVLEVGPADPEQPGEWLLQPGDRVSVLLGPDQALASHVVCPQAHAVVVPGSMPLLDAAVLGVTAVPAYLSLVQSLQFHEGCRVLVIGGESPVGMAAVQLASSMVGVESVAVVDSDRLIEVLDQGCTAVVNAADVLTTLRSWMTEDGVTPTGLHALRALLNSYRADLYETPPGGKPSLCQGFDIVVDAWANPLSRILCEAVVSPEGCVTRASPLHHPPSTGGSPSKATQSHTLFQPAWRRLKGIFTSRSIESSSPPPCQWCSPAESFATRTISVPELALNAANESDAAGKEESCRSVPSVVAALRHSVRLWEMGIFRPRIGGRFLFRDATAAWALMHRDDVRGSVLLFPRPLSREEESLPPSSLAPLLPPNSLGWPLFTKGQCECAELPSPPLHKVLSSSVLPSDTSSPAHAPAQPLSFHQEAPSSRHAASIPPHVLAALGDVPAHSQFTLLRFIMGILEADPARQTIAPSKSYHGILQAAAADAHEAIAQVAVRANSPSRFEPPPLRISHSAAVMQQRGSSSSTSNDDSVPFVDVGDGVPDCTPFNTPAHSVSRTAPSESIASGLSRAGGIKPLGLALRTPRSMAPAIAEQASETDSITPHINGGAPIKPADDDNDSVTAQESSGRPTDAKSTVSGLTKRRQRLLGPGHLRSRLISRHVNTHRSVWDVYEKQKELGVGMTGKVFLVKHKRTGQLHALKMIDLDKMDTAFLDDLRSEISFLQLLDHPNVISLHETFEDDTEGRIYLLLEYCSGGELFDRLHEQKESHFTEAYAAALVYQMLSAVAYCHRMGIAHRDLKLENFLLSSRSPDARLKLIDFGLSNRYAMGASNLDMVEGANPDPKTCAIRKMTTVLGTAYYTAPEILAGTKGYSQACDVWSLGVIAYMLLSGTPPFRGRTDGEILERVRRGRFTLSTPVWKGVSEEAKDFIRACLKYNPAKRPSAVEARRMPWFLRVAEAAATTPPGQRLDFDIVRATMPVPVRAVAERRTRGASASARTPRTSARTIVDLSAEHTPLPLEVPDEDSTSEPRNSAVSPDEDDTVPDEDAMTSILDPSVVGSLRDYCNASKLKRTALATIAFSASPAEVAKLRDTFCALDTDGTGILPVRQIMDVLVREPNAGVSRAEADSMLAKLKDDGQTVMSYSEFLAAAMSRSVALSEPRLREAFNRLDGGGTGFITVSALRGLLGDLYSDEELAAMIREVDSDSDGRLSFEDFRLVFQAGHDRALATVAEGSRALAAAAARAGSTDDQAMAAMLEDLETEDDTGREDDTDSTQKASP
jgi:serine/threonine protein kinase/Ca2+-binding EF-hand superfamily protein